MKLALLADLHGALPVVPDSDVVVIAGDIAPDNPFTMKRGNERALIQAEWMKDQWLPWALGLHRPIVAIWGNHDFVGMDGVTTDWLLANLPDLHWLLGYGDVVRVRELVFAGHPYVHNLPAWAFNLDDDKLSRLDGMLTHNADVWVTHGPPYRRCDKVNIISDTIDPHVGSVSLNTMLNSAYKPQLHVCGHIHEGRGVSLDGITHNVSYVDERYRKYDLPIPVVEL